MKEFLNIKYKILNNNICIYSKSQKVWEYLAMEPLRDNKFKM